MKKKYQSPKIKIVALHHTVHLLSASDNKRGIAGGPVKEGVAPSVTEGFNTDNLFGGQNGVSNRSRETDWFEE